MKKLLAILVVYLLTGSSITVTAQNNLIARNNTPAAGFSAVSFGSSNANSSLHPLTVSKRVMKKFAKQFTGVTDAAWVEDADGFVVRFTSAGIQNWAFLTSKGKCYGTMRYYTENNLPAAVRNQITERYADFEITSVKEVRHNKKTAYLVTIADDTTWKVIQVIDGKTAVWEEHEKD